MKGKSVCFTNPELYRLLVMKERDLLKIKVIARGFWKKPQKYTRDYGICKESIKKTL